MSDRYSATFGNRVFIASVIQIPDEVSQEQLDTSAEELREQLLAEVIKGFEGKREKPVSYQVGDVPVLSQSTTVTKDRMWARLDTLIKDRKCYTFIVYAPQAAKNGPEVEEFFKSIQPPKAAAELSGAR